MRSAGKDQLQTVVSAWLPVYFEWTRVDLFFVFCYRLNVAGFTGLGSHAGRVDAEI